MPKMSTSSMQTKCQHEGGEVGLRCHSKLKSYFIRLLLAGESVVLNGMTTVYK